MFWENAVEYLRHMVNARAFKPCHCVQHPWKLTSRDFWSSRNEWKPLSRNVFWENAVEYLRKWCYSFQTFAIVFQHPWKLTSRWSSRNEKKPLSKMFWENAGYLRNSECYSFQTFAIVFSTPWNLLVGITGALGTKESHFLSWNLFWENAVEYLRNGEC